MNEYGAALGDRIMVLEGFFSNSSRTPAPAPVVDSLTKVSPDDVIAAARSPQSESAKYIKGELRKKAAELDELAKQKHRIAIRAEKNAKASRDLIQKLLRIASARMKKAEDAPAEQKQKIRKELAALARRLVKISERTYGYEKLSSLASAMSAHAKIGSILVLHIARAIDVGNPDYVKDLLIAIQKVNRALDKKVISLNKNNAKLQKKLNGMVATLSRATSQGTAGLGDIFEDFANLFGQLFCQMGQIGKDIMDAFHEISCPVCKVTEEEWFNTSVKAVAMAYGGPQAVAQAEKGVEETQKYGDCKNCQKASLRKMQEFAEQAAKVRPKLINRAIEVTERMYKENPNILLYRQVLSDRIRGQIADFLWKGYKTSDCETERMSKKEARTVAEAFVSVNNLNEIFNKWALLHGYKEGFGRVLSILPIFSFSPGSNQWKTVPGTMGHQQVPAVPKEQFELLSVTDTVDLYGWCLKNVPNFVSMSYKKKWQHMRAKADSVNHSLREKDKSKYAQTHYIARNRSINARLGSVSGGNWKDPETLRPTNTASYNKVKQYEKNWYEWVPEGHKEAEAASAFVQGKIDAANQHISEIESAKNKINSLASALSKNPQDVRLAQRLDKKVALAKALLPLLKGMAADVAQYDQALADDLNRRIRGLETAIARGDQAILVVLAGQIKDAVERLKMQFQSQKRVGNEIIANIKVLIKALDKNPNDEASRQMLSKLVDLALDLKNRVLASYREDAVKLRDAGLINSIESYMLKLGGWADKGRASLSKAKATGKIEPKTAAIVAAVVAAPLLLLI